MRKTANILNCRHLEKQKYMIFNFWDFSRKVEIESLSLRMSFMWIWYWDVSKYLYRWVRQSVSVASLYRIRINIKLWLPPELCSGLYFNNDLSQELTSDMRMSTRMWVFVFNDFHNIGNSVTEPYIVVVVLMMVILVMWMLRMMRVMVSSRRRASCHLWWVMVTASP